jgi:hypothetical protein
LQEKAKRNQKKPKIAKKAKKAKKNIISKKKLQKAKRVNNSPKEPSGAKPVTFVFTLAATATDFC